jgi:hypothetical protein
MCVLRSRDDDIEAHDEGRVRPVNDEMRLLATAGQVNLIRERLRKQFPIVVVSR